MTKSIFSSLSFAAFIVLLFIFKNTNAGVCKFEDVQNIDWSQEIKTFESTPTSLREFRAYEGRLTEGSPLELHMLAYIYKNGFFVEESESKAISLLRKSISFNFAPSMFDLAEILKDDEESNKLYCRAAKLNYPDAQVNIGSKFLESKDYEAALKWFNRAREQGSVASLHGLIELHEDYNYQYRDKDKALNYFVEAAEKDDISKTMLGEHYLFGYRDIVPKDLKKAEYWLIRAVESGQTDAYASLIHLYYHPKDIELFDEKKSFEWAKKGAELNDIASMKVLAVRYYQGIGTVKDTNKAITLFKEIVALIEDKNNTHLHNEDNYIHAGDIAHFLSTYYSWSPLGAEVNLFEAEKWLKKSLIFNPKKDLSPVLRHKELVKLLVAREKFDEALYYAIKFELHEYESILKNSVEPIALRTFGEWMVYFGNKKGLEYFEKASELGDADSEFLLSTIYSGDNEAVALHDDKLAFFWTKKAANKGHAAAMANLGNFYRGDYGVEPDYQESLNWLFKAKEKGESVDRFIAETYVAMKDYQNAVNFFTKSAEADDPIGLTMASLILSGDTVDGMQSTSFKEHYEQLVDLELAFSYAIRAARVYYEQEAMFLVGYKYLNGHGVKKDAELAKLWISRSINNDPKFVRKKSLGRQAGWYVKYAKKILGELHNEEIHAVKFETGRNKKREKIALGASDEDTKFIIAKEYLKEGNIDRGLYWLHEISNYIPAQLHLGNIYHFGYYGIKNDFKRAAYWYQKGIDNNSVAALESLGLLYVTQFESAGIENPLFDIDKARRILEEARDKGSYEAILYLIYLNRYIEAWRPGVFADVELLMDLINEALEKSENAEKREELYVKALEIQSENNKYIDNTLAHKGMQILNFRSSENSGDFPEKSKSQIRLAKVLLNKQNPNYDRKAAKEWLHKASEKSIEANIQLAELYYRADDYNFFKHGDALKKAIDLFERKHGNDFSYYNDNYRDGIIDTYHSLANFYIAIDAYDLAEVMARKASSLYDFSEDNLHEINKNIILATAGKNIEESKKLLLNYLNSPFFEQENFAGRSSIEGYQYFYSSLIGLQAKLRSAKRYRESVDFLIKFSEKFGEFGEMSAMFRPILELEIARDYVSLGEMGEAKKHLELYEKYRDANKPDFFDKLMVWYKFGSVDALNSGFDLMQQMENPVESVLYDILSGIIDIDNNNIASGKRKIIDAFSRIKKFGIPVRAVDLDFAIIPIRNLIDKDKIDEAKLLMREVVEHYKFNSKVRARDGFEVGKNERKYISKAVSDYIYVSSLSGDLPNKGFKEMQLVSGLTLAKSLIESIKLKKYSGSEYAIRKILKDLKNERDELITLKFDLLSENAKVNQIDGKLNQVDEQIASYERQINQESDKVLDGYISSLEDVQNSLRKGDAIIATLASDNRSYVWLVLKNGIHRASSKLNDKEIREISKQILDSSQPDSELDFPFQASNRLYRFLIEPFEDKLEGVDRLIFIPDDALSSLPFSILTKSSIKDDNLTWKDSDGLTRGFSSSPTVYLFGDDVKWLINDYAITIVPSIYSFIELEKTSTKDKALNSFAGIGNPILHGNSNRLLREVVRGGEDIRGHFSKSLQSLAPLPETEEELKIIADVFKSSDLLLGDEATELNIRNKDLSGFDVISFATHALVSNEINELLEPALVLTPVDAHSSQNDGLLTSSEVSGLDLNAEMVLLSACNTASSKNDNGSEGLTGLANSFFTAGAKSLFVSYWPVNSQAAKEITTGIFNDTNAGESFSHRHRNAILRLIKDSKNTIKSHPRYWAPFSVIGIN